MRPATFLSVAAAAVAVALAIPAAAKPVPPTPAPVWSLKDVDGKTVRSADFKGKVLVVDFWATWCPPCRTEIPAYIALQKKYAADGVVFVGVSVDGDDQVKAVKDFMQKFGVNYPMVMADDSIQGAFGVNQGYPTTYIIDREGRIRNKKVGREAAAAYEQELVDVLKPAAPKTGAGPAITP
jgi:thiol-disulfide isomerase/thioredoxin